MKENLYVQYVGFQAKPLVREYTFQVKEGSNEPREFTLTIANEAFHSHLARYQDAPDICSLKLQHELEASANRPEKTHYRISDAELEDYRFSHTQKSSSHLHPPRPARAV